MSHSTDLLSADSTVRTVSTSVMRLRPPVLSTASEHSGDLASAQAEARTSTSTLTGEVSMAQLLFIVLSKYELSI